MKAAHDPGHKVGAAARLHCHDTRRHFGGELDRAVTGRPLTDDHRTSRIQSGETDAVLA